MKGTDFNWQLLLCINIIVHIQAEDNCVKEETTITCKSVPINIPDTVQHVYITDLDLENDVLEFASVEWAWSGRM